MRWKQLNFPGMEPMLRTAADRKEYVRNKLSDFAFRQRLRNLKRAYRRERDQKRRRQRRDLAEFLEKWTGVS